jgi:hypothetical protein
MPDAKPSETKPTEITSGLGDKLQDLMPKRRTWQSLSFTGFEAQDSGSTLFRRWTGSLRALRSDGTKVSVPISMLQNDTPSKMGNALEASFEALSSYLGCECTNKLKCSEHEGQG